MTATLIENAAETAKVLGISERDALALEFLAARTWALIKKDNRAAALMHVGGVHAAGLMDGPTMRQCMETIR